MEIIARKGDGPKESLPEGPQIWIKMVNLECDHDPDGCYSEWNGRSKVLSKGAASIFRLEQLYVHSKKALCNVSILLLVVTNEREDPPPRKTQAEIS
jgi:hypothetical protein